MAIRTIVACDLDGNEPAETLVFGFEGASYEVDLCAKDRDAMEKALRPYLDPARKASSSPARSARSNSGTSQRQSPGAETPSVVLAEQVKGLGGNTAVREWAKSEKRDSPERGRLPLELLRDFIKAQGQDPAA